MTEGEKQRENRLTANHSGNGCGFDGADDSHFPSVIVDNFLPDEIIEPLLTNIDSYSENLNYYANNGMRMSVLYGSKSYLNLMQRNEFKRLHDYLVDPKLLKKIHETFKHYYSDFGLLDEFHNIESLPYVTSRTEFFIADSKLKKAFIKFFYNPIVRGAGFRPAIRKILRYIRPPFLYPTISLSHSRGGYLEPVHVDSRHKIFVGLIYLDDMDDEGEVSIFNSTDQELSLYESPMFPPTELVREYKKVSVKKNRLLLFLNTNNAWHGTNSFVGDRKFIYFSIAAGDVESSFASKFSNRLADRTREEDGNYPS